MRRITTFKRARNSAYNCIVTYPDDFDKATEKLPMIVFLHGIGERGDDIELVAMHGIPKLFSADSGHKNLRVITVSPQCPANEYWRSKAANIMKFIDNAAGDLGADKDKIALTGLSMGGIGTFALGAKYPSYFSCLAPVCGIGKPENAKVYGKIPIRIFHGSKDDVIDQSHSIAMHEAIAAADGNSELTIYEGVGHASWVNAYEESDLISWLASQSR